VKFKAVPKRAKDVASFVRFCPSPVESERCVRGKGLIKKGEIYLLDSFW
jgi:hypothetical protein